METQEREPLSPSPRRNDTATNPSAARKARRLFGAPEVVAALIGAGVTVLLALVGAGTQTIEIRQTVTNASSGELSDETSALQNQVAVLEKDIKDLTTANRDLETENSDLRAQIDNAPLPTDEDTGEPVPSTVLRQTDGTAVTINSTHCIDLDSQEKNWNVGSNDYDGRDLCYDDWGLELSKASIMSAEPTFEECRDRTQYSDYRIPAADLRDDLHVCGKSDDGREAYVYIAKMSDDDISFHLRIWNDA